MSFLPPLVAFEPISLEELNECLVLWQHKMGPLERPRFAREVVHGLRHNGELLAVTATEPMIAAQTCGLHRDEAFELARVCAARPHLCRVAVRLWREFVFPAVSTVWGCPWAISYQDAVLHSGDLYRHDGWVRLGFTRSGTDKRAVGDLAKGRKKVVWGWHADPKMRQRVREAAKGQRVPRWAERVAA